MGRFFEKRGMKGNDTGATMDEQEDIDSFCDSEDGEMISVCESNGDIYYSKKKGERGVVQDIDSESDSDSSDSAEYYNGKRIDNDDDHSRHEEHSGKKDDDTEHSPTSVTNPISENSSGSKGLKIKEIMKPKSFLGKLFGGKKKSKGSKKNETSKSYLSEGDIERSDTGSNCRSQELLFSVDKSRSGRSANRSRSERSADKSPSGRSRSIHVVDSSDDYIDVIDDSDSSAMSEKKSKISRRSKKSTQENRRKKYEHEMPGVTEEGEEDGNTKENIHQSHQIAMNDPARIDPSSGHVKKVVDKIDSMILEITDRSGQSSVRTKNRSAKSAPPSYGTHPTIPPNLPRHSNSPVVKTKKSKIKDSSHSKSKDLNSTHSKSSGKLSKKQRKAQRSESKSKNHKHSPIVSGRVDATGKISLSNSSKVLIDISSAGPETPSLTNKLNNEVHRLSTLLELMMTRMELYERQSECLVEASVDHNKQWKMATIENYERTSKINAKQNPTEQKLSGIKNLLVERSVQDQWIRNLEAIQRGYQERLTTTQDQLKKLRQDHVRTNKQIMDKKKRKENASLNGSGSTFFTPENNENALNNLGQQKTPLANNVPMAMARWTDNVGANNPLLLSPNNLSATRHSVSTKVSGVEPEGKKMSTMLEEMIVSWQIDAVDIDATDMSPLSEKGVPREKVKDKDKKKKKDKKEKKKKKDSVASTVKDSVVSPV